MDRFEATFKALAEANRKGLVGYLTAGDPDLATSEANIRTAIEGGLDVLELGVPFSDPTADGPTIQAAAFRALQGGITVAQVLELVARLRADYPIPIVLFGYANPLLNYGYEAFCRDAAAAGADGLLVVDLPFEETDELRPHTDANGLALVPLIAPTTPPDRAREILSCASGFAYYIMVAGVTGKRAQLAADLEANVAALRECTDLPIAVGFGVSNGEQARQAAAGVDAVVVGSALVDAAVKGNLAALVAELRAALD
jgi:tryptophan synthase alpha chain